MKNKNTKYQIYYETYRNRTGEPAIIKIITHFSSMEDVVKYLERHDLEPYKVYRIFKNGKRQAYSKQGLGRALSAARSSIMQKEIFSTCKMYTDKWEKERNPFYGRFVKAKIGKSVKIVKAGMSYKDGTIKVELNEKKKDGSPKHRIIKINQIQYA